MRVLAALLTVSALAAQSQEGGRIEQGEGESILAVDGPRPVDSAAITLAQHFGMRISVEDPPYVCNDDEVDVTTEVARGRFAHPILVPRGGALRLRFESGPEGAPVDRAALVHELVRQANGAFPFQYRAEESSGVYMIVPRATRDQLCNTTSYLPMLDRRVTIPFGRRRILESAGLLAEALSAQTGLRVSCCQSHVAGIPWGLEEVEFGADEEPARDVLRRLIAASLQCRPDPYFWLLRCDPQPSQWCFINLRSARPEPNQ